MRTSSGVEFGVLWGLTALLTLSGCGEAYEASTGTGSGGAGTSSASSSTAEATATATSTSASTGAGSTCPSAGDNCTTCESAHCSKTYCDCAEDSDCVQMAACVAACSPADPKCPQKCWSEHSSAISKGALLVDCAGTTCSSSCPGYKPVGACSVCLYTSCAPQMNACLATPDCTDLLTCLNACTTPSCPTSCYDQHKNGTALGGQVATCLQMHCAQPCKKG